MPKIYVYLWFDVEDYVSRESDDPPLIFVNILKKCNVPVTCKLVSEKVRALIEHGRSDVISAISDCDVGSHSDTHSQHPTVWEYLADLDVTSGAKEFMSREERGLKLLSEVFHRTPSCYGHPGVMWAPHAYPALREMGIPVYLDETGILNLDDQPYWYCGVLNLNGAGQNLIRFDYSFEKPSGIVSMKSKFNRIYRRLHKGNGGAVSILLHPQTAVNKKMWDVVNFARGKNRAKDQYERPPAQPRKVTERAYEQFEEFIRYVSSFEDVQWITASDAAKIYQRPAEISLERNEWAQAVKHFLASQSYMKVQHDILSPAEGFYLVTMCLAQYGDTGTLPDRITVKEPLGPMATARTKGKKTFHTKDFIATTKSASVFMNSENCIPTSLCVGDYVEVSPHDFLATACKLLGSIISAGAAPDKMALIKGAPPQTDHLSISNFKKDCEWVVLPRNFRAPKIFEQARLQAWTLKPAIPKTDEID